MGESNKFSAFSKYVTSSQEKGDNRPFSLLLFVMKQEWKGLLVETYYRSIPWAIRAKSKEEAVGFGWSYLDKNYPASEWTTREVKVAEFRV